MLQKVILSLVVAVCLSLLWLGPAARNLCFSFKFLLKINYFLVPGRPGRWKSLFFF